MNTETLKLLLFGSSCIALCLAGISVYLCIRLRGTKRRVDRAFPPGDIKESESELYIRSCHYMAERRPYLNPDFTISDLSASLLTNTAYLSKAINQMSGRNFRNYVNYYRVNHAKELFTKDKTLTVKQLASISGFSNTTSFNNAFKTLCGDSPGAWCKKTRMGWTGKH